MSAITVRLPEPVHDRLRAEAVRRRSTVSGLLSVAAQRLAADLPEPVDVAPRPRRPLAVVFRERVLALRAAGFDPQGIALQLGVSVDRVRAVVGEQP